MSKFFVLLACVLTSLLVLACGQPTNRNAEATATTTGDTIGIPECDNFITAYESCVSSKVPEATRVNLKAAVTTWRTEWKKMADDPRTRGELAAHCKAQREATITQMKAFNCTW